MSQFRPLPRFAEIEEAEQAETQPVTTPASFPETPPPSTGPIRLLLLSGPQPTSDTDRLTALVNKTPSTTRHSSLTTALQAAMGTNSATSRLVVIPAGRKKKKALATDKPERRLNLRQRHFIVLLITLGILVFTLVTLAPLATDQNGFTFLGKLANWLHSAQIALQLQTHQDSSPFPVNQNLPPMTIAHSPYVAIAQQDAINAGISPVYFVRQIEQESGFNTGAVSVTNAQGIAQFEPATAASLGINPWDPVQALRGAAQLMARYYHQYGDYAKALAAYNAGTGAVQQAENACGANWLRCMPGQTRNYVYRIMGV